MSPPAPEEVITPAEIEEIFEGRIVSVGAGVHDHGEQGFTWTPSPLLVQDGEEIAYQHLGFHVEATTSDPIEARAKHGRQSMKTRVEIVYSYQRRPLDEPRDRRAAKTAGLDLARNLLRRNDAELLERIQSVRLAKLGPYSHARGWTLGRVALDVTHDIDITDPSVGA